MLEFLSHSTTAWVAISFFIFIAIAYKLGRSSILNGLDSRIDEVKGEIETAERLRVEAQELLAQYQRKQRDAEKEAGEIIDRAQAQATRMTENSKIELQVAVAATTQAIAQTLDEKSNADLNEKTIGELPQNLN